MEQPLTHKNIYIKIKKEFCKKGQDSFLFVGIIAIILCIIYNTFGKNKTEEEDYGKGNK